MEQRPIFRDRYEVTEGDLEGMLDAIQASDDHIVLDGISGGRAYVGFNVTQSTATSVKVDAGRLYFDGRRHFRDDPGGVTIDLLGVKPNLQKRVIAIVAWPEEVETDVEYRDYEIDAETGAKQPQEVTTKLSRRARLEAVPGVESVAPQAPVIDASAVVIATVLMSPAGVESITQVTANQLANLANVAGRTGELEDWRESAEPQISTLSSDLAKLAQEASTIADRKLLYDITASVARIQAALEIPASYLGYRANRFLDESDSNTAAAGYAARIAEGLRLPYAAQDTKEMALLNPFAANVKKSAGGLVLPTYTKIEKRITKGQAGEIALAQYAYENRTLTRTEMSRSRIRYGADFEVSTASQWFLSGSYVDRVNGQVRNVFTRNGENFQVYDTGEVDADGHKIVRLSKFWTDYVSTPYWSREVTDEVVTGYAHIETFLNTQDSWVVSLGPHITRKPQAGNLTIGICETFRGEPDMSKVIAMVTIANADVQLNSLSLPEFPNYAIEPTFLQGGKRYGLFVITSGDYWMGVTDNQQPATGSYFYGMNGGVFIPDASQHLIWRIWTAHFDQPTVSVDLEALALAGGIQSVDALAQSVVPASTDLAYEVQVGGVWTKLDAANTNALAALPNLVPFRATFVGTPDVMPGLRLTGSQVQVGRLATAAKYVSPVRNLAAAANTIKATVKLHGFDAAHHTLTATVDRAGNLETADAVVTSTLPDGTVQKDFTFNMAAASTQYSITLNLGTDSAANPFNVVDLVEIAT